MSGNTIPNGYTRIYFSDRKTGKKDAEYYDVPSNMTLAFGDKEYDLKKYGKSMTIKYSAGNDDYKLIKEALFAMDATKDHKIDSKDTLRKSSVMAERINRRSLPKGYSVHQGSPVGDDWDARLDKGEGWVRFTKGDHFEGQQYNVSIFDKKKL